MGWQYSEKTKQLFMDAVQGKTGTHVGEVENADGVGEHGSVACGDALKFTFRVERDPVDPLKDKMVEARFLTFGCTSAIAASEALCRIIEERRCSPIEALKITNQDVVDFLEGLPNQKIHCSVMGAEALEAAQGFIGGKCYNDAPQVEYQVLYHQSNSLGLFLRASSNETGCLCSCW